MITKEYRVDSAYIISVEGKKVRLRSPFSPTTELTLQTEDIIKEPFCHSYKLKTTVKTTVNIRNTKNDQHIDFELQAVKHLIQAMEPKHSAMSLYYDNRKQPVIHADTLIDDATKAIFIAKVTSKGYELIEVMEKGLWIKHNCDESGMRKLIKFGRYEYLPKKYKCKELDSIFLRKQTKKGGTK